MPEERSPAYQWYPRDYNADESVVLMNLEQEGAYRRLLDHEWLNGSVPNDVRELAIILRVSSTRMKRIWPVVSQKFTDRGDGRLINARLEREREKQTEWREKQAEAGRRGAQKRWKGNDSDPNGDPNGKPIVWPLARNSFASASAVEALKETDANASGAVAPSSFPHPLQNGATPTTIDSLFDEPPESDPDELPNTHATWMPMLRGLGYDASRSDGDILKVMIRKGVKARDIEAAIRGLPILVQLGRYPIPSGQKLNMRILYASGNGKMPAWTQASDAYYEAEGKKKPVDLGRL